MSFTGDSGTLGALADVGEAEQVVEERPRRRGKRFGRRRRREIGLAYLLILPSLLIFGVFVFYPFFKNFYLGFYQTPPFPGLPSKYVGFDQYRDVLTSTEFVDSLKTTVGFALLTVPTGGVEDQMLTRERIAQALGTLSSTPTAALTERFFINPKRGPLLAAGAVIVDALMRRYDVDAVRVTDAGLREGAILVADHVGRAWRDRLPELAHGWRQ